VSKVKANKNMTEEDIEADVKLTKEAMLEQAY
jgi:hypothetical protein